jgi:hypothetical protein
MALPHAGYSSRGTYAGPKTIMALFGDLLQLLYTRIEDCPAPQRSCQDMCPGVWAMVVKAAAGEMAVRTVIGWHVWTGVRMEVRGLLQDLVTRVTQKGMEREGTMSGPR